MIAQATFAALFARVEQVVSRFKDDPETGGAIIGSLVLSFVSVAKEGRGRGRPLSSSESESDKFIQISKNEISFSNIGQEYSGSDSSSGSGSPELSKPNLLRAARDERESVEFRDWYAAYPRHEARRDAWKAWQQVAKFRPPVEKMLTTLSWQKTQSDWTKDGGQFIPLPATYLRKGRWADERRQQTTLLRSLPPQNAEEARLQQERQRERQRVLAQEEQRAEAEARAMISGAAP